MVDFIMKITMIFPNVGHEKLDLSIKSNDSQCLFFSIGGKEVAVLKEDILTALKLFEIE
jgi:hypothetical protein